MVVTGYVEIPNHPRGATTYDQLGQQLGALREAPIRPFRGTIEDCWLHQAARIAMAGGSVEHATGDNPVKNTLAYHSVQHQKTAWLQEAVRTDRRADVVVWLDYGILHQPGVTIEIIDAFLRRVREKEFLEEVAIPGAWARSSRAIDQPDWRFCGSATIVPRYLVRSFHQAVLDVTLERLAKTGRVTWEINDWAVVESLGLLPIRWYAANHDQTQFTNY